MPSRPVGRLLDLEYDILDAVTLLDRAGEDAYGFALARTLSEQHGTALVGHGTLYKALGRLAGMGLLESEWGAAPDDGRPRRRLYRITGAGERVRAARPVDAPRTAPRAALS